MGVSLKGRVLVPVTSAAVMPGRGLPWHLRLGDTHRPHRGPEHLHKVRKVVVSLLELSTFLFLKGRKRQKW